MKTQLLLIVFLSWCILINSQENNVDIINISKGQTIKNRTDFEVSITIDNYDASNGYYWLVLATAKGIQSNDWNRTLVLCDELLKVKNAEKTSELVALLSRWELENFWPKFYINNRHFSSKVHDGGNNPLSGLEPQPMILAVLKVDDTLNNYFKQWFREGASGKGYPGISFDRLSDNMILSRCEIFFP